MPAVEETRITIEEVAPVRPRPAWLPWAVFLLLLTLGAALFCWPLLGYRP